ncbi:MAG: hypothetical protein WCJ30_01000 [Deltaproteobacteria bacterium]
MNSFRISAGVLLTAMVCSSVASAQSREVSCVPVESRRILAGERVEAAAGDRMAVAPLPAAGPNGERFVLVLHEGYDGLTNPHAVRRDVAELGYEPMGGLGTTVPSGRIVVRLDEQLRTVGDPVFVQDPVATPRVDQRRAGSLPVALTTASGVLVLERLGGDLFAMRIPATGAITPPARVATAPVAVEGTQRGFEWITAVARRDGAVALAGTYDGQVVALRFDRDGTLQGAPAAWAQRVGGPMALLPTFDGPLGALLGRPVPGTGPHNEQARMQALVTLDDHLRPTGEPFATGFAQFPLAAAQRGRTLNVFQWVEQQGVAIASLPVGDRRFGEQLPRLFYAQPPLEGSALGTAATLGASNIVYNVGLYGEPQAGVHGHVLWLAPGDTQEALHLRRDVLAMRTTLAVPPVVLPAGDGVVVFTAGDDETGGGVDAYHVRCDLLAAPAR